MRILDSAGHEITNPDLQKGHLVQEKLFLRHHEATPEVQERSHLEEVRTYENGGKEFRQVIDTHYAPAREAWDEYEDIRRYVAYTPQELEQLNAPGPVEQLRSKVAYIAMMSGLTEVL